MLAAGPPSETLKFGISGDGGRVEGLSNLKTRGSLWGSIPLPVSVNLKTRGSLLGSNPWPVSMNLKTRGSLLGSNPWPVSVVWSVPAPFVFHKQSDLKLQNLNTSSSLLGSNPWWSVSMKQNSWSTNISNSHLERVYKRNSGTNFLNSTVNLATSIIDGQRSIGIAKVVLAVVFIFILTGGFEQLVRLSRSSMHWSEDSTEQVSEYYKKLGIVEGWLAWILLLMICSACDPVFPTTEAGRIGKIFLTFLKSVVYVLAPDYGWSSLNPGRKNYDITKYMDIPLWDKFVYTALFTIACVSLVELLGLGELLGLSGRPSMDGVIAYSLFVLAVKEYFLRTTSRNPN